jgi:F5/8 type C domain-containing protein
MLSSDAEPPRADVPPAPAKGRASRLAGSLTQHLGSPRAMVGWAAEPASTRALSVRWVLLGIGVWGLIAVWSPARARGNLARRASVTMSSTCDAKPGRSTFPVEPARLVDGKTSRDYDACTTWELHPWVQLDLGVRAAIDKVVVLGRADCCWGVDALPLVLEVSEDGQDFRQVRRRNLPFTRDEPWRVPLDGSTARMIRLRADSEQESDIVLTEIEVYGRPVAGTPGSSAP